MAEDGPQGQSEGNAANEFLAVMNPDTESIRVCPASESAKDDIPAGQVRPFDLPELDSDKSSPSGSGQTKDLIRDVELDVRIELGRSRMRADEVLKLGEGSVVELDKLTGEPVDVLVNNQLVARGEVMVLNDNFCVRISEIVAHNIETQEK